MFQAPGGLSELSNSLLQIWNDHIQAQINRQFASGLGSRFFVSNADDIPGGQEVNGVKWAGAPAEPGFCLDRTWAQRLSDWGVRGRHETQNEYCEYLVRYAVDSTGRMRPKRVEFTSELREYWVLLAEYDPDALKSAAKDVLGSTPSWSELYGHPDPKSLSQQQRRLAFGFNTAGHGLYQDMQQAGVPAQPSGAINRENLLFMTHPINGLDDLIYVVMFGAVPYRVTEAGVPRKALLQEIFRHFGVEHLACRNADPAAAAGPYNAVWDGRSVAFAPNLGMYLRPLNPAQFEYDGAQIPEEWIRFSRGKEGMYQRLSFGPMDSDDGFLDDIFVLQGASRVKISGGFQVAELLEVGPLVVVSPPSSVVEQDYRAISASPSPINCREAGVCQAMRQLKSEYENSAGLMSTGTRTLSRAGSL
jgi:hypothetical protein